MRMTIALQDQGNLKLWGFLSLLQPCFIAVGVLLTLLPSLKAFVPWDRVCVLLNLEALALWLTRDDMDAKIMETAKCNRILGKKRESLPSGSLTTHKGGMWNRKNVFGGRRRPKNWSSDPRGIKLNFSVSCPSPSCQSYVSYSRTEVLTRIKERCVLNTLSLWVKL